MKVTNIMCCVLLLSWTLVPLVLQTCNAAPLSALEVAESAESPESSSDEDDSPFNVSTSVIIILTILIALSIGFEIFKDFVEERAKGALRPIVEHFWQELTVLGFLSLLSFLVVKMGFLSVISKKVFSEDDTLAELVEQVHMLLFAVMVVFICVVLLLVRLGNRIAKEWHAAEKACGKPKQVADTYREARLAKKVDGTGIIAMIFPSLDPGREAFFHMEYMQIRQQFIQPTHTKGRELKPDFSFSHYLKLNLGEMLGEFVEIPWTAWAGLWVVFIFAYGMSFLPNLFLIIFSAGFSWILFVVMVITCHKLDWVRKQLIVKMPRHPDEHMNSEKTPLVSSIQEGGGSALGDKMNDARMYTVAHEDLQPAYLENAAVIPRGALGRHFLGSPPNKQEQLFWFDRKGPEFLTYIIRQVLLLCSIYISCLALVIFIYVSAVINKTDLFMPVWEFVLAVVACILPLFLIAMMYAPHAIRRMVISTNIEMLKNAERINAVIRHQKTKKTLSMLKMISMMKSKAKAFHGGGKRKTAAERAEEGLTSSQGPRDEARVAEISAVFDLFDKDGGGTVSAVELGAMMRAMGHNLSEAETLDLLADLDSDGSGELDREEFVSYMIDTEGEGDGGEENSEEAIRQMFAIFDKDGSGAITSEEFRDMMNSLGERMTHEDIDAIINEVDRDGDGEVSLEEFIELTEKHMND